MSQRINVVVTGHVDHGKSTLVGRLLYDTQSLPQGKIQAIQNYCEKNAKPFEYAFLLDALKEERRQGITMDVSRVFFKGKLNSYQLLDAPGHVEFLKNMITGAAQADAAILVIDVQEGIQENSRRHGMMLSFLGVRRVVVVLNKMDLVDFSAEVFTKVKNEYSDFLSKFGLIPDHFIPASAYQGEGLNTKSQKLEWYSGPTIFEYLESLKHELDFAKEPPRFCVQDVYRFSKNNDDRRIIAGSLICGSIEVGQKVSIFPSGQVAHVRALENLGSETTAKVTGPAHLGFTLDEDVFVRRGDLIVAATDLAVQTASFVRTTVFWLANEPLTMTDAVILKINTQSVLAKVSKINRVLDSSTLDEVQWAQDKIQKLWVVDCDLQLTSPITFDLENTNIATHRFVLVKNHRISGGGLIKESLEHSRRKNASVFYDQIPVDQLTGVVVISRDQIFADIGQERQMKLRFEGADRNIEMHMLLVEGLLRAGQCLNIAIDESSERCIVELKSKFRNVTWLTGHHASTVEKRFGLFHREL